MYVSVLRRLCRSQASTLAALQNPTTMFQLARCICNPCSTKYQAAHEHVISPKLSAATSVQLHHSAGSACFFFFVFSYSIFGTAEHICFSAKVSAIFQLVFSRCKMWILFSVAKCVISHLLQFAFLTIFQQSNNFFSFTFNSGLA